MKLYIASSWSNSSLVIGLANILREEGHEVDCFCDESSGRYVFHWSQINPIRNQLDAVTFLQHKEAQRAFTEDKKWLDWAEGVILVLPAGRSAHLEAGYAVGQGKLVWAWGSLPKGEWDVMYGFFQALYREEELHLLLRALK